MVQAEVPVAFVTAVPAETFEVRNQRRPIDQRRRAIVLRPFSSSQDAKMNYTQAQLKYRLSIAAGALLFTGALISTVFSTLKMLHWRLDSYTTAAATINHPIKNFMFTVYEK